MSDPSREKQPEIGSGEWEANREREIRELRAKEREEAAEYARKKEAGLLPDTPALSKVVAAASKVHPRYKRNELIGRLIMYGGLLLLILAFIMLFG